MARRQRAALVAGSLLSLAALLPPLSRLADQRLSLHMLEEMLLLALVIPLLAYGSGPLLPRRLASWMHPVAGILALNVVLFGSQYPAVLDLAVKNAAFREATLVAFMLSSTSPDVEVRTSATRLFEQFLPLALYIGAVTLSQQISTYNRPGR